MSKHQLQHLSYFTLILFIITLSSCLPNTQTSSGHAKAFANWAQNTYIQQFDLYQVESSKPNLTDARKSYLMQKREVLVKLDNAIRIYNSALGSNLEPSPELEQTINTLVNSLIMEILE